MITSIFNFFLFLQGPPPPPYSQPVRRHSSVHPDHTAGSSAQLMMHNVLPNVPASSTQSVIPATIPTDVVDLVLSSEGGVSMGPGVQNTFNAGQAFQPPLHGVLLEVL